MFRADRLRNAMVADGLTQSELARRVGVTQTTIRKLASGSGFGSKYIHRIAQELGTTPAYLMGETDDPQGEAPILPDVTSAMRDMVDVMARLRPEDQAALLRVAKAMAGDQDREKSSVQSPLSDFKGRDAA